jgi:endonuclease I
MTAKYEIAGIKVALNYHYDEYLTNNIESYRIGDFERNRNDVIYSYQHNRNPFIDYPEFVAMIDFTVNQ